MLKKMLNKTTIFNKNFLKMTKKKKINNVLVSKNIITNINSLGELLISTIVESPLFIKYLMLSAFVINPIYNIVKTYKEKKYNNALEFVYKLYENRDVYRIKPYGVLSIIVIVDLIRKIKSFF